MMNKIYTNMTHKKAPVNMIMVVIMSVWCIVYILKCIFTFPTDFQFNLSIVMLTASFAYISWQDHDISVYKHNAKIMEKAYNELAEEVQTLRIKVNRDNVKSTK